MCPDPHLARGVSTRHQKLHIDANSIVRNQILLFIDVPSYLCTNTHMSRTQAKKIHEHTCIQILKHACMHTHSHLCTYTRTHIHTYTHSYVAHTHTHIHKLKHTKIHKHTTYTHAQGRKDVHKKPRYYARDKGTPISCTHCPHKMHHPVLFFLMISEKILQPFECVLFSFDCFHAPLDAQNPADAWLPSAALLKATLVHSGQQMDGYRYDQGQYTTNMIPCPIDGCLPE